jgi:cellulose synthase/poly-beta-1,6-N-acetylglucosamine synthase-like glycosyltransferase
MILILIYFALYFSIFTLLLILLIRADWQKTLGFKAEKVPVSILIAARNEAHNILNCLQAISRLHYPQELVEVLIGDDNSTDNTNQLVAHFIKDKPNFRLVKITGNLGQARGKSNVLAHLTRLASTNYFFITDADIEVPETWIHGMLARVSGKVGIVTGITTTKGQDFFSRMQALDWLNSLGYIQVVADRNLPVSTMGNNMLVTREAYESTGGYENMPFSITEDVQLFNAVLKNGYQFKNVYHENVLAQTAPAPDLPALMHQRKRWMKGAVHLPLYLRFILIFYGSFYLFLTPFFFRAPFEYALLVLLLKWVFQTTFLKICLHRLRKKTTLPDLILFEGYQLLITVASVLFFFLPFKVTWKGRKY